MKIGKNDENKNTKTHFKIKLNPRNFKAKNKK